MLVRALQVSAFRNLQQATLEPGPRFNVFAGNNGQGKTNLLEALYSVCTLRSFRTSRLRELVAIGKEQGYVAARVERDGLERKYELTIKERSRVVRLDGKAVTPIARYFGQFNVVLFAPEDLLVARGSPSERRKFLDRAVFTRSPSYLQVAQDFEKVLRSRNATLKNEELSSSARSDMLSVYDQQLSTLGAAVWSARRSYLQELEPRFVVAFDTIARAGMAASLSYETALGDLAEDGLAEGYLEALRASRAQDLARGSTSKGPHRDVLEFLLAGQSAASFASQGQTRAMILAWKTAEMDLLEATQPDPPVLLLDDVSSELDPERNRYLFEFLRQRKNQCFISTTHPSFVLLEEERRDFLVEAGVVTGR